MKKRYLSTARKNQLRPHLLTKQKNTCLFCNKEFETLPANDNYSITFEHLNKDVFENNIWNLALVHKDCNNAKKWNIDYQIIAKEQLDLNLKSVDSMSVSTTPTREPKPTSKEIDINVATFNLTEEYLRERLDVKGMDALDLNDTIYSIFYLLKQTSGHGSSETVKRTIFGFTSTAGPYDKQEDQNGNWIITKKVKKEKINSESWVKEEKQRKMI